MNKKNSILVLERDNMRINHFDMQFKNKLLLYKVVKNITEFFETLMQRKWDYVFIEHDLAQEALSSNDPASGYNALVIINEQYPYRNDVNIRVHTANPVAMQNMSDYCYVNNLPATFVPFGTPDFKAEMVRVSKFVNDNAAY